LTDPKHVWVPRGYYSKAQVKADDIKMILFEDVVDELKKLEAIETHLDNHPVHADYPRFATFYEIYTEWVLKLKDLVYKGVET